MQTIVKDMDPMTRNTVMCRPSLPLTDDIIVNHSSGS